MAVLAIGLASAAALGPLGLGLVSASTGWMIGVTAANLLGVGQKDQNIQGPRIGDLSVQSSTYGTAQPIVFGSMRTAGNVIWCTDIREVATTEEQGGKGGPTVTSTTYSYNVDIAIALCANEIAGIRKIFKSSKLVFDTSVDADIGTVIASSIGAKGFKLYYGTEDQLPDPTIEAALGVGNVPAYKGTAYAVFTGLDCPGGRIEQLNWEVLTSASTSEVFLDMPPATLPMLPGAVVIDGIAGAEESCPFIYDNYLVYGGPLHIYPQLTGPDYVKALKRIPFSIDTQRAYTRICASGGPPQILRAIFPNGIFSSVQCQIEAYDLKAGTRKIIITMVPGAANWLQWYGVISAGCYAAFDEITGYYVLNSAYSTDEMILGHPPEGLYCSGGPAGGGGPVAFYDGIIYRSKADGVNVYLQRFNGETGVYIDSVMGPATTLSSTDVTRLCANEFGVFAIRGVTGKVYKITTEWEEIATGVTDYGSFYCNGNYAVVGPVFSGSPQKYKFITVNFNGLTPIDLPLAGVIEDICDRAGLDSSKIDTSEVTENLTGYAITNVSSARSNIDPLLKTFQLDAAEFDGKVNFFPRAGLSSVATVSFDDLGAAEDGSDNGERLPFDRQQSAELPRSVAVSFLNVESDYQTGTETSSRSTVDSENDSTENIAVAMTPTQAKTIADVLLYDAWQARTGRKVKVPRAYSHVTAGDVVSIEYPKSVFSPFRVINAVDTGVVCEWDILEYDGDIYTVEGVPATLPNAQSGVVLQPPTKMMALDIPILSTDAYNDAGLFVALTSFSTDWNGADLYRGKSIADTATVGRVRNFAPQGFIETAPVAWTAGIVDETSTITLQVSGLGELSSITRDVMLDTTQNVIALGAEGRWEILQFAVATDLGNGRYTLSRLNRGLCGTEQYTGTHQAGDGFAVLQVGGILRPEYQVSELGETFEYRTVSIGREFETAVVTEVVNTGVGLKPYSPVNLRASRQTNGDIRLTWDRRTRMSENWLSGIFPLGESSEQYEVEIESLSSVVRTLTVTSAQADYELMDQYQDASNIVTDLTVTVYQISESVGRGSPLNSTITVAAGATGSGFPGASSINLYAAAKAGSAVIAVTEASYSGSMQYKVAESYDNGVTFTALSGLAAPVSSWRNFVAAKSDGTYISLMGSDVQTKETKTDFFLTRGQAGSLPVLTTTAFSRPNPPVCVATDGTNFKVITEGNSVYTSTDGLTWTLAGVAALPTTFVSVFVSGRWASNYLSVSLVYESSRWFIRYGSFMYYTSDSTLLTGWTLCVLPSDVTASFYQIAKVGTDLFCTAAKTSGPLSSIIKSTDSGATWTYSLDPAVSPPSDVVNIGGVLASVVYDFAGKTNISSDGGATWSSPSNSRSFVDRFSPLVAGSNILISVLRAVPSSGQPTQQIVYSSNGTTFTASTGV